MNLIFLDTIPWDYDAATPLEEPLGGSQSALCHLAAALARRGHQVTLCSGTTRPRVVRGVDCLNFGQLSPTFWKQPCDAVVVVNGSATRALQLRPAISPTTPLVLWLHNAPDHVAVQPLRENGVREAWDAFVCVSEWHRHAMVQSFALPVERVTALFNAVAPAFEGLFANAHALMQAKSGRPILVYTSAPFRGLEILLDVFTALHTRFPETTLRVYSSMKMYRLEEGSDAFAPLYKRCRSLPGVDYIGGLPQPRLAEELRSATILAYPSTFVETSCIAALEAMAAGLAVVTSDLGALPETTAGLGRLVPALEGKRNRQDFCHDYLAALTDVLGVFQRDPAAFAAERIRQVQELATHSTWDRRAEQWEQAIARWQQVPQRRPATTINVPPKLAPSPAQWYGVRDGEVRGDSRVPPPITQTSDVHATGTSAKPQILYILHSHGKLAGVDLHAYQLATRMQGRYRVASVFPDAERVHLLIHEGGPGRNRIAASYPARQVDLPATPLHSPEHERALANILATVRPDIIHIQHFLNWPIGVLQQAIDWGVPVILSAHDYYAITPLYTMQGVARPEETFTAEFCRRTFGQDLTTYLATRRDVIGRAIKSMYARVAVSPFLERQLNAIYPDSYRVIEYGIAPFKPVTASHKSRGLRFGYFGNLIHAKGWHVLLEAFRAVRGTHPGAELHLHGWCETPPRAEPGVFCHGTYQPQDIPALSAGVDVAIIPSLFPETYCLVLSEMWLARLPAAVSDIGALGDRVRDGINGKKFTPGDAAALTDTLRWFLEHDEWRQWTLPVPRLLPAMIDDYDRLYQEALAARHSSGNPAPSEPLGERKDFLASDMLIVQVCDFGSDGDAQYRLHEPSRHLARLPGVVAIDCHFYHRFLPELADVADVLVVQFVNDWELLTLCHRRRELGKVTVFEANDFFFDIQPWNPIAARWQDRNVQELFLQLLAAADGVQTSTEELARRWQERGTRRVAVFANHLPEVPPLPPDADRPLTVGWAGSPGHFADWYHTVPTLARWLAAHPDVHLAVMSNEFARPFVELPPERYRFTPFGSLADYLRFLRTLDIGLAPLLPTEYNRCRSDVKFLEYASQGVAGIYADLEPYRSSVVPGETGLLYKTGEELIAALEQLRADKGLRLKLRRQAHDYVQRHRRMSDHIGDRLTWYRSLAAGNCVGQVSNLPESKGTLKTCPTGPRLSTNIMNAADRDGNYLRLHAQEPERALMTALQKPTPRESTPLLAQLLQQQPRYVAALQSQGQLLNDLRDHRAALSSLEQARELMPHSAKTWSEIGRAWYRLNDDVRARAALEEAIRVNSHHLPSWQYLLRLLSLSKSPDGVRYAQRAEALFPSCYPLALLGAQTYPPAQSLDVLLQLLDKFAPKITSSEKPLALAAFRQAILAALQACSTAGVKAQESTLALLRRACALFPESARLAHELGTALYQAGHLHEACQHHARALALRHQAVVHREEFPGDDAPPCLWQVAETLCLAVQGEQMVAVAQVAGYVEANE